MLTELPILVLELLPRLTELLPEVVPLGRLVPLLPVLTLELLLELLLPRFTWGEVVRCALVLVLLPRFT